MRARWGICAHIRFKKVQWCGIRNKVVGHRHANSKGDNTSSKERNKGDDPRALPARLWRADLEGRGIPRGEQHCYQREGHTNQELHCGNIDGEISLRNFLCTTRNRCQEEDRLGNADNTQRALKNYRSHPSSTAASEESKGEDQLHEERNRSKNDRGVEHQGVAVDLLQTPHGCLILLAQGPHVLLLGKLGRKSRTIKGQESMACKSPDGIDRTESVGGDDQGDHVANGIADAQH